MEIPVLVEPAAGGGWVARTGPPFGATAEGASADDAVGKVRDEVARRVAAGAVVTSVAVPGVNGTPPGASTAGRGGNPLLALAGTWDDHTAEEFRKAVEEYRREIENDPNR